MLFRSQDVVVSPDQSEIYVADESGSVAFVSLTTGTITRVAVPGAFGMAMTPDGSQLWTTQPGLGQLTVLDRLTRAIGVWEHITVYTDKLTLKPGDQIILCSDGVETAGVSVDEMRQLLSGEDLDAGVKRVIGRCRERGAPDNITLAVARLEGAAEEATQVLTTRTLRPRAPQGA